MHTVRCDFDGTPTVRFGAVLKKLEIFRCGSVRFSGVGNPTVRFGAVIYLTVRLGAVFKNRKSYGAVRCSFQTP